jgi:hypothetical protein
MNIPFKEIINSTRGKYLFSVLLGLGLATLFRKACNSRNCLTFKAPSLDNIKGKTFGFNKKCYKFEEKSTSCSDLPNIITLETDNKNDIATAAAQI